MDAHTPADVACLVYFPVYVERKNEEDPSYEAACDVSELMSCSRVRQ